MRGDDLGHGRIISHTLGKAKATSPCRFLKSLLFTLPRGLLWN